MLKGADVRFALLQVGYNEWEKFPSRKVATNIKPLLDSIRNKHPSDITNLVIESTLQGMIEDELMQFEWINEDNLIAIITPTGREAYLELSGNKRTHTLAYYGAAIAGIGLLFTLVRQFM